MPQPNLFYGFNLDIFSNILFLEMDSQIKGIRWGIVQNSSISPTPSLFHFHFLELFTSFQYFNQWYHTLKCICTVFIFSHSFSHFEFMTVEHKRNILKTALEALGEMAYYCPLSQRWMLHHSFLYGKKMFALNSLLEENGFTFLECVRTPWQGWNINRIKNLCIYWTFILILFRIKWALYYM